MPEHRRPQKAHHLGGPHGGIRLRTHGTQCRCDQLEWTLHLVAIRRPAEELRARHDRAYHLADVAIRAEESLGGSLHQLGRRRVAHESGGQLARNEMCRGRMSRYDVQHRLAILDATARRQHMTQHHLLAGIMEFRAKHELRRESRVHRPSGECACNFDDVALCVAAIHAQRVEFHQFARVILVQAALAARGLLRALLHELHPLSGGHRLQALALCL